MELVPIGVVHSAYSERGQAPRQGRLSDALATLEVFPPYADALEGVERCSHLIVLYWGDRAERTILRSRTPFGTTPVGVFASRSPNRPNPIAFCVADLVRREGNRLLVRGVDALDGSPLLDIKVYSAAIDAIPGARAAHIPGTLEGIGGGEAL